ncbi:MAG: hypothetical protein PVI52_05320 [Chromatiales bacterium]|jgi:hypothetical protein
MARLPDSLRDWGSAFAETLKGELQGLKPGSLPLLKCVTQGGLPNERDLKSMLLGADETQERILVRVGVFFTEVRAGCSCGDEPMALQAYCELQIDIDRTSAEAKFTLLG